MYLCTCRNTRFARVCRMLKVGDEVLCRIDRISKFRGADVTVVDSGVCGVIRLQDIGAVCVSEAFVPGDIVRAIALSVGDMKSSFFSTAAKHLGVFMAKENEEWLVPIDQGHMRNPSTGIVYKRKVAQHTHI